LEGGPSSGYKYSALPGEKLNKSEVKTHSRLKEELLDNHSSLSTLIQTENSNYMDRVERF